MNVNKIFIDYAVGAYGPTVSSFGVRRGQQKRVNREANPLICLVAGTGFEL